MTASLFIAGQTTAPSINVPAWMQVLLGVLGLLVTIFMPFILGGINSIKKRLSDGDMKFEEQGKSMVRLETQVVGLVAAVQSQSESMGKVMEKMTEVFVEGRGSVDEHRIEVERHFVRKEDLHRLETKTDEQHGAVMQAIADLKRDRK